ncbi:MAG: cyclic nucleotide-binding domain-containing protein [Polyangiales bacterium]
MSEATLRRLSDTLAVVQVHAGNTVVHQGKPNHTIFLVLSGAFRVVKQEASGAVTHLRTLTQDDIFGEVEFFALQPCIASVRCDEPGSLLLLPATSIDHLIYRTSPKDYAMLLMNLGRVVSRKLIDRSCVAEL